MKSNYLLLGVLLTAMSAGAQTIVPITDADLGSGTYNWTKDKIYQLDGMVYLETGGKLNIEAGTLIQGLSTPGNANDAASALVITKGAQIFANGTASEPIIFTTDLDDISTSSDLTHDDRALWGGIIILGNGILGNGSGTGQIEGIPSTEPRGSYGGSNNGESSGSMRYVSIRHGGAVIGANNEINGLTLGGVGSGTVLEFIEVFANEDDGIEFFGGAASVKYALVSFCGDDSYDWDEAWVGKGQFWISLGSSTIGDCGFEGDGANPASATPVANPVIYNVTLIGAGNGATAANSHVMLLRDNTNATIANSIFVDFAQKGIQVQDAGGSTSDSYSRIGMNPGINILNNIWHGIGSNTTLDGSASGIIKPTSGGDDATAATLTTHMTANGNQLSNPQMVGISRSTNGGLDPRPMASIATSGLAAYPVSDSFFDQVSFKGAVNPANTGWLKSWNALWTYGYLSGKVGISETLVSNSAMTLYPNPTDGNTTLSINTNESEVLEITVVDLLGRTVLNVYRAETSVGTLTVQIDGSSLRPGTYLIQLKGSKGHYATEKLIVK